MNPSELLRLYGQRAKKSFGQHFLTDSGLLGRIVDAASLPDRAHVLEIGPGCGTLTATLLERGHTVTAVELDRDAAAFLREELQPRHPTLEVLEEDALEFDLDRLPRACRFVVANLPYNVGTPILFRLLEADRFERLALMFQKEVARRLVASPGNGEYGAMTLRAGLWGDAKLAMTLKPGAFTPPPSVDSAVVVFDTIPGGRDVVDRDAFVETVTAGFATRRKTIRNALKARWDRDLVDEALQAAGVEPRTRAERLASADFDRLSAAIREREQAEK